MHILLAVIKLRNGHKRHRASQRRRRFQTKNRKVDIRPHLYYVSDLCRFAVNTVENNVHLFDRLRVCPISVVCPDDMRIRNDVFDRASRLSDKETRSKPFHRIVWRIYHSYDTVSGILRFVPPFRQRPRKRKSR